jgi:hypothetical protein
VRVDPLFCRCGYNFDLDNVLNSLPALGPAGVAAGEAGAIIGSLRWAWTARGGAGARFITSPAGTTLDLQVFQGLARNPGTIAAGRSGAGRSLMGPPNSYSVTSGGHALVYGPEGRLLLMSRRPALGHFSGIRLRADSGSRERARTSSFPLCRELCSMLWDCDGN